jgi:hypothetical protein
MGGDSMIPEPNLAAQQHYHNLQGKTFQEHLDSLAKAVAKEIEEPDPYQTKGFQDYIALCSQHCECSHDICGSVLAGGLCEMRTEDDNN